MNDIKQKLEFKKAAFDALLARKQKEFERVRDFQRNHLDSINDADRDQSEIIESQTENMMRETRIESESLDHIEEELNFLKAKQSFGADEEIRSSSVIKSSFGNFVVGVAEEEFDVNGEKFIGISTNSPIYQALEGKKEGDKVKFNDQQIEIHEVV